MQVVRHRPGRRVSLNLTLALLGFALLAGGYLWGHNTARVDQDRVTALEGERRVLAAKIQRLERDLEAYRLSTDVETRSGESLRTMVADLQTERAELKEEVRFYRRLMAPGELEKGLQIAELNIASGGREGVLEYDLLLTQASERRTWVQGRVNVDVLGHRNEEFVVLSLTDLTEIESYPLRFRFRYFQDFTGTMTLPADFRPESVVVTAIRDNGQDQQRTFEWAVNSG